MSRETWTEEEETEFARIAAAAASHGYVLLTEEQAARLSSTSAGGTIAHVTCGTPPPEVRTLAQWIEWRRLEDLRMERELAAQVAAHFERVITVPTEH